MKSLKQIRIQNYKAFDDHVVSFTNMSVIVGRNNGGKTTLVEVIQIIAQSISKLKNRIPHQPNQNLGVPKSNYGVQFPLATRGTEGQIFNRYREPPAIIEACFTDDTVIEIYILEKQIAFASCKVNDHIIHKKLEQDFPNICVLPQIGPLLLDEIRRTDDYVKEQMLGQRSSLLFRNQLRLKYEKKEELEKMMFTTWGDVGISEFIIPSVLEKEEPLQLLIREQSFVTEIGMMGHGIQMWIQMLWFLVNRTQDDIVVLDEPDVYLHPDMERKLIRLISSYPNQHILTTHSTEIITEVDSCNVIVLDKSKSMSMPSGKFEIINKIIDELGSIHNVAISKMFSQKTIVFYEGYDSDIVRKFQKKLFPNAANLIPSLPTLKTNGWNGWSSVIGFVKMIISSGDPGIRFIALFDRDFHTDDEIKERVNEGTINGIIVHVWKMKEIENYLLVIPAIKRLINRQSELKITEKEVQQFIEEYIERNKDDLIDKIAEDINKKEKNLTNANRKARAYYNSKINTLEESMAVYGGKSLLKELRGWAKKEFNASLSDSAIISEISLNEVSKDLVRYLEIIG